VRPMPVATTAVLTAVAVAATVSVAAMVAPQAPTANIKCTTAKKWATLHGTALLSWASVECRAGRRCIGRWGECVGVGFDSSQPSVDNSVSGRLLRVPEASGCTGRGAVDARASSTHANMRISTTHTSPHPATQHAAAVHSCGHQQQQWHQRMLAGHPAHGAPNKLQAHGALAAACAAVH
jgi:hypothetical protein